MSTVALPAQYIPASTTATMYGGQSNVPHAHAYDPSKLYDSPKIYDTAKFYDSAKIYDSTKPYDNITSGNSTAAAYLPWNSIGSQFKYDALPPNWPSTATANAANSWYGHQTTAGALGIGHIVKPELQDYRYVLCYHCRTGC